MLSGEKLGDSPAAGKAPVDAHTRSSGKSFDLEAAEMHSNAENNNITATESYENNFPSITNQMDSTVCKKRKANSKKPINTKICIKDNTTENNEENQPKTIAQAVKNVMHNLINNSNETTEPNITSNNMSNISNSNNISLNSKMPDPSTISVSISSGLNTPGTEPSNILSDSGSRMEFSKTIENDHMLKRQQNKNSKEQFVSILQPVDNGRKIRFLNNIHIIKDLARAAGDETMISRIHHLKQGGLLVQVATKAALEGILKMQTLAGIAIYHLPPNFNATCKGVIRNVHPDITAEDIIANLKENNIPILVAKKMENARKIENMAVLTFPGGTLPYTVTFLGAVHTIDPYIEAPIICGKCFKFSHHKDVCRAKQVCLHCAKIGHDHNSCGAREANIKPTCANCGGAHTALKYSCPARKVCVEILRYKTHNKVSFQDAKKVILPKGCSYEEALRKISNKTIANNNIIQSTFYPSSKQTSSDNTYSYASAAKSGHNKKEQTPNYIPLTQNKFLNAKPREERSYNSQSTSNSNDDILKSIFNLLSSHFGQTNNHSRNNRALNGQQRMYNQQQQSNYAR